MLLVEDADPERRGEQTGVADDVGPRHRGPRSRSTPTSPSSVQPRSSQRSMRTPARSASLRSQRSKRTDRNSASRKSACASRQPSNVVPLERRARERGEVDAAVAEHRVGDLAARPLAPVSRAPVIATRRSDSSGATTLARLPRSTATSVSCRPPRRAAAQIDVDEPRLADDGACGACARQLCARDPRALDLRAAASSSSASSPSSPSSRGAAGELTARDVRDTPPVNHTLGLRLALRAMVVVGTWNLENLFRPGTEFGPRDEQAYEAKLTSLADVINRVAPDVLAVQEVGDPEALADLAGRLDGSWETELSTVFEEDHPIRVAVISQLPLSDAEQVSRFPALLAPIQVDDEGNTIDAMVRGALRVRVTAGARAIDVVTCHLKSKLLTFPGGRFQPHDEGERARYAAYALDRRAAEAVTVRARADGLLEGHGDERDVIVLGDFNDVPLAATTQILLGPPGSEIGTPGFDRPDRGDPWRLWNLAPLIPEERRYTRVYRGRRELIDHIFVSRALVSPLPVVDTGDVEPPSITEVPSARRDEPASDHAPVVARFDF